MTASASVFGEGVAVSRSRFEKSDRAYRIIGEVSLDLDVAQHVLRFWEAKFSQIRPVQRAGGRRYYRPEDVDLLRRIRSLLYEHGYTIKGVQRLLKERRDGAIAHDASARPAAKLDGGKRAEMQNVLADLQDSLELLRRTLHAPR